MSTLTNSTNLTIRIDRDLKKEADSLFNELGTNTSAAITMFIKQALREKSLPFNLKLNEDKEVLSKDIKKLMKEIKNIEKGKGKKYDNLEELWEDLDI